MRLAASMARTSESNDASKMIWKVSANDFDSGDDPFTIPTPTGARSALSPTASSFTPGQVKAANLALGAAITTGARVYPTRVANVPAEAVHGRVSSLSRNSVPDLVAPRMTHLSQAGPSHGAIGNPSYTNGLAHAFGQMSLDPVSIPYVSGHYRFSSLFDGQFTSEEKAQRAIRISGDFDNGALEHLSSRFNVSQFNIWLFWSSQLTSNSDKALCFSLRHGYPLPDWSGLSLPSVLRHS